MKLDYKTSGTCSTMIRLEVEDGVIKNVRFENGCDGNTKGIAILTEGMRAEEAIKKLKGIRCGNKATSCPDQLALALTKALNT